MTRERTTGDKILSDAELDKLLIEAHVTEIEIMEYADGTLAAQRRPAVRAALAAHPDLMQVLESFLYTRDRVADAFDEVYRQTPPEWLLGRLKVAERPPARPRREFFGIPPASRRPVNLKYRAPVFAAAALAAVLLAGWLMNFVVRYDFIPPDRQGAPVPPLVQQALESVPMGETASLSEHLSAKMQLTFYSRLQAWCREYGLIYGDRAFWVGQIACRGNDDVWRVHAFTNPLLLRGAIAGVGEDGAGLLARARDDLKHRKFSDMLGPEEEVPFLKNHWQGRPGQ